MNERLINAVAFEEELEDFSFGGISLIYDNPHDKMVARHTVSEITFLLDRAPTIEAKPVVHAHWKDIGLETKHKFCTKCGGCVTQKESWVYKYCPCCGAQMDEVASDINVGSKGVKIPVISMEDVLKSMEEAK